VGKNWADGGFSLGGSYKHINQPAYRFLDNTQDPEGLPALLNLHGSVTMGRERSAGLLRMLFMSQGAYRQFLVGGELLSRFGNKRANNPNFMLGLAYRASRYLDTGFHSDAAVISLQTQVSSKLQIAASYDLSLSSVRRVSNNGAFELALQLVFAGRWKCPTRCPDF
jgi:hypothetical protein